MWQVRLYSGTGLNAVNTVDNPAILEDADYIDVPAIDVLQGEHLSSIRIKATREQVKNVDFLRLTDGTDTFFYSVDPFHMSTTDVTDLIITQDPVLTAAGITNGIDKVEYGDGIVERHHVAKNDDNFGAYTEADPLLVPSKELAMDIEFAFNDLFPSTDEQVQYGGIRNIIQSTLDLYAMGKGDEYPAITYIDSDSGQAVPVPQPIAIPSDKKSSANLFYNETEGKQYVPKGSVYYDGENLIVKKGIERARAMGIEGGILASYNIPGNALNPMQGAVDIDETGVYDELTGNYREHNSGLTFEFANPQNKRVLYGELCQYEIFSVASGVSISYRPEAIRAAGNNSPVFCAVYDPRPEGRPYFRTKYYRGTDITQAAGGAFLANAVAGMEWAKEPLVYTGVSGSTLMELKYNTNREIAKAENRAAVEQIKAGAKNFTGWDAGINVLGSAALGAGGGALLGGIPGAIIGGAGGLLSGIKDQWGAYKESGEANENVKNQLAALQQKYAHTSGKELQEFMINTTVTAPEIHFPASETLRDYIGNGACIVRYRPAQSDIAKLDKILNMFGYKDTSAIDTNYFTNRSKFNYIMIKGLSVVDKRIPLYLREQLAVALGNGVRIWHQLPDTSAYTDGTNV